MVLKYQKGHFTAADLKLTELIIKALRCYDKDGNRYDGNFDRRADESLIHATDRVSNISHDNLTAIVSFSYKHGLKYAKAIADYGLKYWFRYDNAKPTAPRWFFKMADGKKETSWKFHPRDWFYYLYCGGYKLKAAPFFPVFLLAAVVTAFSPKEVTSGKLMWFTRLYGQKGLPLKLTWSIFNFLMKRRHGKDWLSDAFIYYFKHPEHPVRVLASEITFE
jgi:hypothetical protein